MLSKAEIDRIRGLHEKKRRLAAGRFVVEGEKVIGELIAAGFPFEAVYATADWPGPRGREFVAVTPGEMARLSHFPTPSPVLAVGRLETRALEPGALERGLSLALDGVQDPGNVGTLIRIADWFGFARVLLSPDCADLHSQKVINASMGSFARVPVHTVDLPGALHGVAAPVLGCDLTGTSVHALPRFESAVVVIGSEGRGLSPALEARLTQKISIPRRGAAESLNAAVAGGIVCALIAGVSHPGYSKPSSAGP